MQKLIGALSVLALLASLSTAQSQGGGKAANRTGERRVALVIGNKEYKDSPLRSSVNDAGDMAFVLRNLGFEVTQRANLTQKEMKNVIRAFGDKLRGGGVGLFYYSGHGVQVNGDNYLIPISAELRGEEEVEPEAVNVRLVFEQMARAKNRLNIVILDACRNARVPSSSKSITRGLASTTAPSGTLIAYATAPGTTASDGTGRNSPYTRALLNYLGIPCLKVEDAFKAVRSEVLKMTGQMQQPWENTSLTGTFYFNPNPNCSSAPVSVAGNSNPALAFAVPEKPTPPTAEEMLVRTLDAPGEVRSVAFSPDGKTIAALCVNNELILWDAADGHVIWSRPRPGRSGHKALTVAFSSDGKSFASAYSDEIVFWDIQSGVVQRVIKILRDDTFIRARNGSASLAAATSVIFSHDGKRFATKTYDNDVIVWNSETGEPLLSVKNSYKNCIGKKEDAWYECFWIHSCAFSPNDEELVCGNEDGTITRWRLATAEVTSILTPPDGLQEVIAVSPNGREVARGGKDKIFILNGDQPYSLNGLKYEVDSLCFGPHSYLLAASDSAGRVFLWFFRFDQVRELQGTRGQFPSDPPSYPLAFSPDGRTLVSGGTDRKVLIWDLSRLH